MLVSYPFTADLGRSFPSWNGHKLFKRFSEFFSFESDSTARPQGKKRNKSNQTKHHPEFALENTERVLLLPQANTHTFFSN